MHSSSKTPGFAEFGGARFLKIRRFCSVFSTFLLELSRFCGVISNIPGFAGFSVQSFLLLVVFNVLIRKDPQVLQHLYALFLMTHSQTSKVLQCSQCNLPLNFELLRIHL